MMMNAAEQAEEFAIAIWHKLQSWKVIHFSHLPQWLQDNDFLHFGHRPPLPTIECFKSIIRIHTETGNIWTHLLGMLNIFAVCNLYYSRFYLWILTFPMMICASFYGIGLLLWYIVRNKTENPFTRGNKKILFDDFLMTNLENYRCRQGWPGQMDRQMFRQKQILNQSLRGDESNKHSSSKKSDNERMQK